LLYFWLYEADPLSVGGLYAPPASFLATSTGKLALAALKLAEDVAIAGVSHVLRHPPDVNCSDKPENANMNGRGVGAVSVAAPIPAMAGEADSADVDVDPFWHIDVDIPERRENGHRGLALVDRDYSLLTVAVRDAHGGVIHGRHARPLMPREATGRWSLMLRSLP